MEPIKPKPKSNTFALPVAPRLLHAPVSDSTVVLGAAHALSATLKTRRFLQLSDIIASQDSTDVNFNKLWSLADVVDAFEELMDVRLEDLGLSRDVLSDDQRVTELAKASFWDHAKAGADPPQSSFGTPPPRLALNLVGSDIICSYVCGIRCSPDRPQPCVFFSRLLRLAAPISHP